MEDDSGLSPILLHASPNGRTWRERGLHRGELMGAAIDRSMALWGHLTFEVASPSRASKATLGELWSRGKRFAAALSGLGLRSGDCLAVQLPGWEECIVTYLACFQLGITLVPIVMIFGHREMSFILRDSGARTLVFTPCYRGKDYSKLADQLRSEGLLDRLIAVGEVDAHPHELSWEALLDAETAQAPQGVYAPDLLSLILYTSGTTADPKGARHTHDTFLAEFLSNAYAHQAEGRALTLFPAGHTAGTLGLFRCFFVPESNTVLTEWDAEAAVRIVTERQINRLPVTPYFLSEMLEVCARTGQSLSSIRQLSIGGTTVDPELVRRGMAAGATLTRSYGSTEHPTIACGAPDDPPEKRISTDGRLVGGNLIRLVDDDGREVALGEEGEILSTGPELFAGYTDERLNKECFVDGIWFRTGDVGRFDADGYLSITDRKKDIIIRGGENISAREVEEALRLHPAVEDAAVAPLKDDRLGERVCAFIVRAADAPFSLEAAVEHFTTLGLAKQKTPERLVFVDVLPRTAIGKVNKAALKALLADATLAA